MKMELRNSTTALSSNGDLVVSGYVNKPGQLSEVLGSTKKFKEKIRPGAFKRALANRSGEIEFLAEHDSKRMLASTRNNSLSLREDVDGLFMEARISPTSYGRDYHTLISDGLIQSMSFGFRTIKDSWEYIEGLAIRTVHELELFEVSAVRDPAYSQSTISARNIDVEDVSVPEEKSEYFDNKQKEKRNNTMQKIEKRTTNEFEQIIRGEERALQTTANGASIIPENVHDSIILKMEQTSKVFGKARKLNSVSGSLRVNRESTVSVGGFVGEGSEILEGGISFDYVDLKQKRVGAALSLSNQLINDSAVNIEEYAGNLLARRTVKAIEQSMLVGLGGEEFNGAIHDVEVTSIKAPKEFTIDNLLDLFLAVHPEFLQDASFVMQRDFFNKVAKMKDNNGHYYLQNGLINGRLTYTLFGMEVDVTDALTDETPVLFGNIEEAISIMIKQQSGLQRISADTQQALRGSQLFVYDLYCDSAVVNPQAIAKMTVAAA